LDSTSLEQCCPVFLPWRNAYSNRSCTEETLQTKILAGQKKLIAGISIQLLLNCSQNSFVNSLHLGPYFYVLLHCQIFFLSIKISNQSKVSFKINCRIKISRYFIGYFEFFALFQRFYFTYLFHDFSRNTGWETLR
jgi:hypothetical protein